MNWRGKSRGWERRDGFTLLELILVTGVLLILAGLLLPAIVRVRAKAHEVQCINNLHQIDLGLKMFSDDNGTLPRLFFVRAGQYERRSLQEWLSPSYVLNDRVFHCSADPSRRGAEDNKTGSISLNDSNPISHSSYTYNDLLPDTPARAKGPSAPLLWDQMAWHGGAMNLAHYDGSIERIEEGTFGRVYFNWYTIISRPDP